jgi:acyl-coenzyme A thioesterase PaaI-like protein
MKVVTGTARIIHKGRTLHLWEIKITDEEEFDFALQVD